KPVVAIEALKPWADHLRKLYQTGGWTTFGTIAALVLHIPGMFLLAYLAQTLVAVGKSLLAESAAEGLASDPRPPVPYLRPFAADPSLDQDRGAVRDLEAGLLKLGGRVGPVVAIGRPGEPYQVSGVPRLYVADEHWQLAVGELLRRAAAVIFVQGE